MSNNNTGMPNKNGKNTFMIKVTVFVLIAAVAVATVSVIRERDRAASERVGEQALAASDSVSIKLDPGADGRYYQYGVVTREYIDISGGKAVLTDGTEKYVSWWDMPKRGVVAVLSEAEIDGDNIMNGDTTTYEYRKVIDALTFLDGGVPYKLITDGVTDSFTQEGLNLTNNERVSLVKSRFLLEREIVDLTPLVKPGETLPNNAFDTTADTADTSVPKDTSPNDPVTDPGA
ncbi:hypothetical protein FACS1894133_6430 [Clostridia bacterium]|nr:hypothetical protein FACS1894133_6430 [Clostridia bacterium]